MSQYRLELIQGLASTVPKFDGENIPLIEYIKNLRRLEKEVDREDEQLFLTKLLIIKLKGDLYDILSDTTLNNISALIEEIKKWYPLGDIYELYYKLRRIYQQPQESVISFASRIDDLALEIKEIKRSENLDADAIAANERKVDADALNNFKRGLCFEIKLELGQQNTFNDAIFEAIKIENRIQKEYRKQIYYKEFYNINLQIPFIQTIDFEEFANEIFQEKYCTAESKTEISKLIKAREVIICTKDDAHKVQQSRKEIVLKKPLSQTIDCEEHAVEFYQEKYIYDKIENTIEVNELNEARQEICCIRNDAVIEKQAIISVNSNDEISINTTKLENAIQYKNNAPSAEEEDVLAKTAINILQPIRNSNEEKHKVNNKVIRYDTHLLKLQKNVELIE